MRRRPSSEQSFPGLPTPSKSQSQDAIDGAPLRPGAPPRWPVLRPLAPASHAGLAVPAPVANSPSWGLRVSLPRRRSHRPGVFVRCQLLTQATLTVLLKSVASTSFCSLSPFFFTALLASSITCHAKFLDHQSPILFLLCLLSFRMRTPWSPGFLLFESSPCSQCLGQAAPNGQLWKPGRLQ